MNTSPFSFFRKLIRLANEGIAYNRFHTVAMCSPTRVDLTDYLTKPREETP